MGQAISTCSRRKAAETSEETRERERHRGPFEKLPKQPSLLSSPSSLLDETKWKEKIETCRVFLVESFDSKSLFTFFRIS